MFDVESGLHLTQMREVEVEREDSEQVAGVEVRDSLEIRSTRKGREGPEATVETRLL